MELSEPETALRRQTLYSSELCARPWLHLDSTKVAKLIRTRSPSSPAPVLVAEVVEHPAGISRRLKTQEVSMKALIFRETGEPKSVLKLEEIPPPTLAPGEALVRML